MDTANEITITIPVSAAAQRHIEDLQSVLTKRNAQIEQLTERLKEAETGEPNQAALGKAYQRGWKDAANHLMSSTDQVAHALGKLRQDAFQVYLKANNGEATA